MRQDLLNSRRGSRSVERTPPLREIRNLIPGRVKRMMYKIDTRHFLVWSLALIGQGKDWLAQCDDNVTVWDIGSWCQWSDLPVGQHYKVAISVCALSQVSTRTYVTLDVARP